MQNDLIVNEIFDGFASANPNRRPNRMSPSLLGHDCAAFVWYAFNWCYELPAVNGRMAKYNARGNVEEANVIAAMRATGWQVQETGPDGNQISVEAFGGHLYGMIDGICSHPTHTGGANYLFENKFVNSKRFTAFSNDSLQKADAKYYGQIQLYMHQLKLPACVWVVTNRNDDDMRVYIIPYDENYANDLLAFADTLLTSKARLKRISSKPTFFKCIYCDARDVCHGEKSIEINCRSCVNSFPLPDAQWGCRLAPNDNQTIPKEFLPKGCSNYTPVQ